MAKKNGEVSKSQAIRDLLTENRKMPTSEVISTLAQNGIEVKPHLVYLIRSQMRSRKRRKAKEKAVQVATASGSSDALATIRKVKNLANEVGGLGKLKALVEALSS